MYADFEYGGHKPTQPWPQWEVPCVGLHPLQDGGHAVVVADEHLVALQGVPGGGGLRLGLCSRPASASIAPPHGQELLPRSQLHGFAAVMGHWNEWGETSKKKTGFMGGHKKSLAHST